MKRSLNPSFAIALSLLAGVSIPLPARAHYDCSAAGVPCPDQKIPPCGGGRPELVIMHFWKPQKPQVSPATPGRPPGLGSFHSFFSAAEQAQAAALAGGTGDEVCTSCVQSTEGSESATWWVSEPNCSTRIEQTPLWWSPARGETIAFHLSYRQRGAIIEDPAVFGIGTNWSCSFRAFLVDLSGGTGLLRLHCVGAGWIDYTNGVTQYEDGSILTTITGGYQIAYASGAIDTFTKFFVSGGYDCYFLTSRLDPAGNADTYNYSSDPSVVQLLSVTDPDGSTNSIYYDNTNFPNQITRVVDPFSRTTYLTYDDQGFLTNVVNVSGLTNSFVYDAGNPGWITTMTSRYGSTGFAYGGVDVTNTTFWTVPNYVNRYVTVTLPTGGHELFLYRQDCTNFMSATYSPQPSTSPLPNTLDNLDQNARNSFHWDALQYEHLSTNDPPSLTAADYAIGRLRHWLMDPADGTPTYTASVERLPSPDGSTNGALIWLDYDDKTSGNNYIGTNGQPSLVATVLPDGTSTRYQHFSRNAHSLPTQTISTFSKLNGAIGQRTNTLYYAANKIDLLQQVGPNAEQVVSNYFSAGNIFHEPDASYDALNQQTTFTYNLYGQVTSVHSPSGLTTINTYASAGNGLNRITNTTDVEISRTNSFTYYVSGLLNTHTDERGLTTTRFRDNLQRLTGMSYPDGTTTSNIYTILDLTGTKDRLGNWSYFGYDALRHKVAETNANGVVTRYGYCDCGALFALTNAWNTPAQMVTTFAYDYQGNRTYTFLPDTTITNWFDVLQEIWLSGDGNGLRHYYYNNQGLLTNLSNAYGTEGAVAFDDEDRPLYITDANSVTITNAYDLLGRIATCTYPDGGVQAFGYSPRGLTAYTNQLGQTNFFAYDAAGRKTSETNANGEVLLYTNNAAGDVLSLTDGKGQTTVWAYDGYGRVTNKLDQTGTRILAYSYDPAGRLTNRWSAAKGNTAYTYDAIANLTHIHYPGGTSVYFYYDWLDRPTNMLDSLGTTAYAYTTGGLLFTESQPFGSAVLTNTYNQRLRVALALEQPTGAWTNGFVYDAAGRLTNVTSQAGSSSYLFASGLQTLPVSIFLPNGSYITNTYDPVARLSSTLLNNSGNTTLDAAEYGYNAACQRTTFTNAAGTYVQYSYDNIGQLKVANSSVSSEKRGYTYDTAWNLNWLTNSGVASQFKVDSKNELTNPPSGICTFDANGNMLTSGAGRYQYTYDDENRLIQWLDNGTLHAIAHLTAFAYDGFGRLRQRAEYTPSSGSAPQGPSDSWTLSSETVYLYDGWRVIQERDVNNNPTVSYTRGTDLSGSLEGAGGIGGLLARSSGYSSSNWTSHAYYHADGNGNITCLLDGSQNVVATYRYDAYGNTLSSSGSLAGANVYRFSSKEQMANSGIYYYGYRYYNSGFQRWINTDPIVEEGGINLYAYLENDPANDVDEFGLQASLCTPGGAAIVADAEAAAEGYASLAAKRAAMAAAAAAAAAALKADTKQHGKGERNWQHKSDDPWKGWRVDPNDPTKIRGKDQNGKDIVKPRPPDFPDPKPKPQRPKADPPKLPEGGK